MILTAQKKFLRGFTLIELLIVIAILGILAAAVLVAANPGKRTKQAKDATRKSDVGQVATALQAYYTTPGQGAYPGPGGCGSGAGGLQTLTAKGDLKQIPTGPGIGSNSEDYCLTLNDTATPPNTEAAIYATLEDPTSGDPATETWLWCWQSTSGKATEITSGSCTP